MTTTLNLSILTKHGDVTSFAVGSLIFQAGDPGDFVYVVKSGEVDIQAGDRLIETVRAGGIFGEMALISDEPRSATAVARTPCELVPLSQKRFLFLVQETPFFALEVMRILARRLRRADALTA
jgi:CRP/FNR family cyclic AMP-dependent transcriptional regulator